MHFLLTQKMESPRGELTFVEKMKGIKHIACCINRNTIRKKL